MKKFLIGLLIFVVLVLSIGRLSIHIMSKKLAERIVINDIDLNYIQDGEYIGSCIETPVEAEVRLVVKDNKIIDIEILRHQHGIGSEGEKIIDKILAKQSLQVDTISGATASSKVILKAVEIALLQGKIN